MLSRQCLVAARGRELQYRGRRGPAWLLRKGAPRGAWEKGWVPALGRAASTFPSPWPPAGQVTWVPASSAHAPWCPLSKDKALCRYSPLTRDSHHRREDKWSPSPHLSSVSSNFLLFPYPFLCFLSLVGESMSFDDR